MSVTAQALRELHRIHRQLTDLRERLDRGPKQVRARQAGVATRETELKKISEDVKSARMAADRKNLELKTGESKIRDLQVKLNACNSNREYQALLDQIAAAKMANSVLSDEILETLESIDQLEAKVLAARDAVQAAKEELGRVEKEVGAAAEGIKGDIVRLETELLVAEQALPGDFRGEYERIVKAKGEDALAPVDDDCCGGCYQKLTANQQNDLYLGRVVACKSCGRLLYLPEGRTRQERT